MRKRKYKPWSAEDIEYIRITYDNLSVSVAFMARMLNRDISSIYQKAIELDLHRPKKKCKPPVTNQERAEFARLKYRTDIAYHDRMLQRANDYYHRTHPDAVYRETYTFDESTKPY